MSNSQAQYSWHSALVLMSSILCIVLAPPSKAVARQGEPPKSWTETAAALSRVPVMQLPPVDIGEELRKAADEADPGPLQVAVPHEVSISPARDGEWEELPEVGRIWRYRFSAPGATDLNFGFTTFRLPPAPPCTSTAKPNAIMRGRIPAKTTNPTASCGRRWCLATGR
jgi:hypothetical protein